MRGNILLVSRWQDCRGLAFTKGLCQVLGLILLYMTFKHKTFSEYGPRVHTGTGTKFVAYLSLSPILNDNISLEKRSKFTLNTNYIHYLSLCSA